MELVFLADIVGKIQLLKLTEEVLLKILFGSLLSTLFFKSILGSFEFIGYASLFSFLRLSQAKPCMYVVQYARAPQANSISYYFHKPPGSSSLSHTTSAWKFQLIAYGLHALLGRSK